MAKKTVLKKLLNTYAPTSIEMQNNSLATAIRADQAVISKDSYGYIDNSGEVVTRTDNDLSPDTKNIDELQNTVDIVDAETGELVTDNEDHS